MKVPRILDAKHLVRPQETLAVSRISLAIRRNDSLAYDERISRQYLREITYSRLSIRELISVYHLPPAIAVCLNRRASAVAPNGVVS
jgi:hypothetical protein